MEGRPYALDDTMGFFDIVAPLYERLHSDSEAQGRHIRERLGVTAAWRVLDVGGGTGRVARVVAPGGNVVVLDPSAGMLRQAEKHGGVRVVRGVAESVPFPDAGFDLVLMVDSLHHFADQPKALAEARRVLRPGGILYIEEFNPATLAGRATALTERIFLQRSRFHRPETLQRLVEAAGFAGVQVEKQGAAYTLRAS